MTGYEIYCRATALLGYSERGFAGESESFSDDYLVFINRILSDLGCGQITDPTVEIALESKREEALLYGVAMMAALSVADRMKAAEFEDRYRKKRAAALSDLGVISDTLPNPEGE